MKERIKKLNYVKLFSIIVFASILYFLLLNFITNGAYFEVEAPEVHIMYDHVNGIISSAKRQIIYHDKGQIYPPLSYLLYNFLYFLNPVKDNIQNMATYYRDYHYIKQTLILYMFYAMILIFIIKIYFPKNNIWNNLVFPASLIFSYTIANIAIASANNVFFVSLILLIAIYNTFYERKTAKKEIGTFFLCAAFSLKLYPCVYAIEYIRKKDIVSILKMIVFFIFLFILPFHFFGGFEGFSNFLKNIFSVNNVATTINYCIADPIIKLFAFYNINLNISFWVPFIRYTFMIIMLIFYFLTKKRYQRILFLTAICMHFFSLSYIYNVIYYLLPLFVFIYDNETIMTSKNNILDNLIFLSMTLIFTYFFAAIKIEFPLIFSLSAIALSMIDTILVR